MYTLIGVSLVSLLAAGNPTGPSLTAESDATADWPTVKEGVWSIEGALMQKGKRTKKWKATTRRCDDASTLFQGYWGHGKAEKDDCLFQSTKLSGSKFEIVGECLAEQNGFVKSESKVTMKGDASFEMEVRFQQGKVSAKAKETGRWVSACTDPETAAAAAATGEAAATVTSAGAPTATTKAEAEASR
jgi:Protein of unknown function (DUF3617)